MAKIDCRLVSEHDNESFLNDMQVAARYGVARSTVWRWVQEGRISKPLRLTPSCSRWKLSELQTFETKGAEADADVRAAAKSSMERKEAAQ